MNLLPARIYGSHEIAAANAEAVFCRHGQAMLGDGVVWGHVDQEQAGIDEINL